MPFPKEWMPLPFRCVLHCPTQTVVVADLHLGYVSARRQDGEAVPHFGEQERLEELSQALQQQQVKTLVIAGDAVESANAGAAILASWISSLGQLGISTHLVPGNHDRGLPAIPGLLLHADGYEVGPWRIVHDAEADDPRCLVQGHLHPCIRSGAVPGEAACFLYKQNRLVLPAWCEHAAGVNVLGMRDWWDAECSAIVSARVVELGVLSTLRAKLSRPPRPYRIGFGLTT